MDIGKTLKLPSRWPATDHCESLNVVIPKDLFFTQLPRALWKHISDHILKLQIFLKLISSYLVRIKAEILNLVYELSITSMDYSLSHSFIKYLLDSYYVSDIILGWYILYYWYSSNRQSGWTPSPPPEMTLDHACPFTVHAYQTLCPLSASHSSSGSSFCWKHCAW